MGIGFGEIGLVGIVLLVVGYGLIVPLLGVRFARKRMKEGRSSVVGVVWPGIHIGLYSGGVIYALNAGAAPIAPAIGLILNGIWLKVSVTANRVAHARTGRSAPSGQAGEAG